MDLRKLLVLLPMWVAYVLGSTIGAYFEHVLGSLALLIPAGCTLTLGLVYTLMRSLLKETIKRFEQERLSEKIREVQLAFVRTGSRLAARRSEDLQEIDEEMGEMMEMLSEVDASVCHLCESPKESPRSVAAEDQRRVMGTHRRHIEDISTSSTSVVSFGAVGQVLP